MRLPRRSRPFHLMPAFPAPTVAVPSLRTTTPFVLSTLVVTFAGCVSVNLAITNRRPPRTSTVRGTRRFPSVLFTQNGWSADDWRPRSSTAVTSQCQRPSVSTDPSVFVPVHENLYVLGACGPLCVKRATPSAPTIFAVTVDGRTTL